ncbi:hypothetical protein Q8F55_002416 [Vanrija albida]|uniref:Zn(2)-C6 fungal-type domain-containing protein n=1 Tax=Vanrija albida TaxID=181172 RepID=A0ABR3Q9Q0_9TREE
MPSSPPTPPSPEPKGGAGAGARSRKRRAVHTCNRCVRLKLKCNHEQPCSACAKSNGAEPCVYRATSPSAPTSPRHESDAEDAPRPPKRHRAVLVCARCKRLKLKCDQATPCASCVRGRVGHDCAYNSWPEQPAISGPGSDPSHASAELVPDASVSSAGVNGSMIDTRLAQIEKRLERLATLTPAPVRAAPSAATFDELVGQFPAADECRRLVDTFLQFDVMFRIVIAQHFSDQAEGVIRRLPHVQPAEAPFLAMMAAAIVIGTQAVPEDDSPDYRLLLSRLITFCEDNELFTLDYVNATLLVTSTNMFGKTASPSSCFLATMKAYGAALLVRIHQDQPGETLFQRERRRRIWWQIKMGRQFLSTRMKITLDPELHDVPAPLVVSDRALMSATPELEVGMPEWAYVDNKITLTTAFLIPKAAILAQHDRPPLDRIMECQRLLDNYTAQIPSYLVLSFTPTPSPDLPPWMYMQSCVVAVGLAESTCLLYQPFFGTDIHSIVLPPAVEAAHKLIAAAKAMSTFLLFTWVDNLATSLWTGSAKVFTGAMVMAYALLSEPNNSDAAAQMASLDTAMGVLRAMCTKAGTSPSTRKAITTLEGLRTAIRKNKPPETPNVMDPYSGEEMTLPSAVPLDLLSDFVEWESLFKDLFNGQLPGM